MTKQERSAALRMAGNIASGIAVKESRSPGAADGQASIADDAVSIALCIFNDPRLEVTEGE